MKYKIKAQNKIEKANPFCCKTVQILFEKTVKLGQNKEEGRTKYNLGVWKVHQSLAQF